MFLKLLLPFWVERLGRLFFCYRPFLCGLPSHPPPSPPPKQRDLPVEKFHPILHVFNEESLVKSYYLVFCNSLEQEGLDLGIKEAEEE